MSTMWREVRVEVAGDKYKIMYAAGQPYTVRVWLPRCQTQPRRWGWRLVWAEWHKGKMKPRVAEVLKVAKTAENSC